MNQNRVSKVKSVLLLFEKDRNRVSKVDHVLLLFVTDKNNVKNVLLPFGGDRNSAHLC
jgi:hypothetical protein